MQTHVLVQPPPLLAFPNIPPRVQLRYRHLTDLSHPSRSPILDKENPPVAQSGPSFSPLHVLDDVPRSGPRNYTSLTSPQQHSISVSNQSRPTPHPTHPRAVSPSDSTSRPSTEAQPSPHFPPSSPPQIRPTPLFPPPYSAPHHQSHFASSATFYPPNMGRYSIANPPDRYLRSTDKYPHNHHPFLDQRRMSEPAMYGNTASGHPTSTTNLSNARHHQLQHQYAYVPPRSFGALSSPLHRSSDSRPISGSSWKEDHPLPLRPYDPVELEEPLSPLNPTFSGGESSPLMGMSGVMFGSLHEDYGPSPPGTGTSTSSNAPDTYQQAYTPDGPSSASDSKQYSFVSLPGNEIRKRPRRRYDEIERLYQCSWPSCTKAYGTLNHLNAHITMQKHGPKRSPGEFKELRKQWRKAKKEDTEARALDAARHESHQTQNPSQHHTPRSMSNAEYPSHNIYAHHPARTIQPIGRALDDLHDPLAHQRDVYPRRSQRHDSFVSRHPQQSGITYPHPHTHGANTSNIPMNRLPASSTLLTPLPDYQPSSMSGAPDFDAYDSYDIYRGDSCPRTGHGSPASHSGRARPHSSHVNLGTGHNRDCP